MTQAELTHWSPVIAQFDLHRCQHWIRYWLVGFVAPNHFLKKRQQSITWISAEILPIRPLGTNLCEVQITISLKIFSEYVVCKMSSILFKPKCVNSLRPSDAIWRQRSRSTLAQVMACCLMARSHYLNQCWFTISKVHWHSFEYNSTRDTLAINH